MRGSGKIYQGGNTFLKYSIYNCTYRFVNHFDRSDQKIIFKTIYYNNNFCPQQEQEFKCVSMSCMELYSLSSTDEQCRTKLDLTCWHTQEWGKMIIHLLFLSCFWFLFLMWDRIFVLFCFVFCREKICTHYWIFRWPDEVPSLQVFNFMCFFRLAHSLEWSPGKSCTNGKTVHLTEKVSPMYHSNISADFSSHWSNRRKPNHLCRHYIPVRYESLHVCRMKGMNCDLANACGGILPWNQGKWETLSLISVNGPWLG